MRKMKLKNIFFFLWWDVNEVGDFDVVYIVIDDLG